MFDKRNSEWEGFTDGFVIASLIVGIIYVFYYIGVGLFHLGRLAWNRIRRLTKGSNCENLEEQ